MNITDYFDPTNIDHLKAYDTLMHKGFWPENFPPEGIEISPSTWSFSIAAKIASFYIQYCKANKIKGLDRWNSFDLNIHCSFSGCSCGCTSYESKDFSGNAPDIYIAIAEWARDFTCSGDGNAIFRKLDIPEESKAIVMKVEEARKECVKLESKIKDIKEKHKSYQDSAKKLGLDIPDPKKDEIACDLGAINAYEKQIKALTDLIITSLRFNHEKVSYEDQED